MEKRKLPRGDEDFSVIGIGLGCMEDTAPDEIERMISRAIEGGINIFDACAANSRVWAPFGRAIQGSREEIYIQMHLGAVYDENGEYGWSRSLDDMRAAFDNCLETIGTGYADIGFLHCVDADDDWETLRKIGAVEHLIGLKESGTIRRVGVSSHTPSVAMRTIRELSPDVLMFSINPAYDMERRADDDELGRGTHGERTALLEMCAAEGVGVTVMKPFCGGTLLDAARSPLGTALSREQCIAYALSRPAVLCVLPGAQSTDDVEALLSYERSLPVDRDWSSISGFMPSGASRRCVYCAHCHPCPAGINIALANKYYDLASAGDKIAAGHYEKLTVKAGSCVRCRRCSGRCPFGVDQADRMREILGYFGE